VNRPDSSSRATGRPHQRGESDGLTALAPGEALVQRTGDEVTTHGSSPTDDDTDDDPLPDRNEVNQHNTDPADPDTDDDNCSDHDELGAGTDPLDGASN
jgi:hypothetical protein